MGTPQRPTFLSYEKPPLTAMILRETPKDCIAAIRASLQDGAEAFGIQMEFLKREYRNVDTLKRIFLHCEGRPIYITSYRGRHSEGYTDEECAQYLLLGLQAGATLCDVEGDLYHKDAHDITYDPEAVFRQKALIEKIHELGGEALISSHINAYFDEEQVLSLARAHRERGADISKIVNYAQTEEQLMANLVNICRMKKELDCRFLLLGNGPYSRLLRRIGPELGVCMYLCVQRYSEYDFREQPLLRAMKLARENLA